MKADKTMMPEWLLGEYLKWKASPRRYETLYPISFKILKPYIDAEKSNEKDKKRPSKEKAPS